LKTLNTVVALMRVAPCLENTPAQAGAVLSYADNSA
jgi:hypothetical protein